MIGTAEGKAMGQDRADGIKNEQSPTKLQAHFSRPPAQENPQRYGKERRHDGTSELERISAQWRKGSGKHYDQVVERRRCVRRSSTRKILKIVSSHDCSRVFKTNARARHPRITIRIDEINVAAAENVGIERATGSKS